MTAVVVDLCIPWFVTKVSSYYTMLAILVEAIIWRDCMCLKRSIYIVCRDILDSFLCNSFWDFWEAGEWAGRGGRKLSIFRGSRPKLRGYVDRAGGRGGRGRKPSILRENRPVHFTIPPLSGVVKPLLNGHLLDVNDWCDEWCLLWCYPIMQVPITRGSCSNLHKFTLLPKLRAHRPRAWRAMIPPHSISALCSRYIMAGSGHSFLMSHSPPLLVQQRAANFFSSETRMPAEPNHNSVPQH